MIYNLRIKTNSLLQKFTSRESSFIPFSMKIGSKQVQILSPLANFWGAGLTKVGRLSFIGECEDQKVKVYSAFSPGQARLIWEISNHKFKNVSFPKVIAYDDFLIAEEWIEGVSGTNLSRTDLIEAATYLNNFFEEVSHFVPSDEKNNIFDYFEDYLKPRLVPWISIPQFRAVYDRWCTALSSVSSKLPVKLSHPDASHSNLIKEKKSGRIFIIDNELVGWSRSAVLNKRNSIVRPVLGIGTSFSDLQIQSFVEETARLREIASDLDCGRFNQALSKATSG